MENIKAIQLIPEEKGMTVHCHHNANVSLAVLVELFEGYGHIKFLEPLYSFQGIRIGTTKIFYVHERDANVAVNSITAKGKESQQPQESLRKSKAVTEPIEQMTLRRPTGAIAKIKYNMEKLEEKEIRLTGNTKTTHPEDIEIEASEDNPFYATHEEGRKVHIIIPSGHNYESVFKGMRQYGEIEYIHDFINKEKKYIALVCYYKAKSAQAAMKGVKPSCNPLWSHAQKIVDFKGKIYKTHEECNRKVNALNFANHKRVCELEFKYKDNTNILKPIQDKTISEETRQLTDEKNRKLVVQITRNDSLRGLQQEFEKYGPLEYIHINIEDNVAYICYFDTESAYKSILNADEKYSLRIAGIETLTGFQGPLKRKCTRCNREVSTPHISRHLAICKEGLLEMITPEERIQRTRERAMEYTSLGGTKQKKAEARPNIDENFEIQDLIDFNEEIEENTEFENDSPYRSNKNIQDKREHMSTNEDIEDNRSVIIEGEISPVQSPETTNIPEPTLIFKGGIFYLPQKDENGQTMLIPLPPTQNQMPSGEDIKDMINRLNMN